jgi:hypothetical protein
MRSIFTSLGFALTIAGATAAQFVPIPLTPGTFNFDMIVEKEAPPPIPAGVTATMDGGTNQTGNTWYEQGYNTASPSTGVPAAGTTFVHQSNPNIQYTMPASYTAPNAILIRSNQLTTGTFTVTTPAVYSGISVLHAAGNGPIRVNYTIRYANATTESGSLVSSNWFDGVNPAYTTAGRVQPDGGTTFNNVGGANPRLYSSEIAVNPASEVASIEFSYPGAGAGGPNATACIFAISGSNDGVTYAPIEVTGYTRDMVVGVGESEPVALTTATTASMDGGTANTGNTWYERGYYPQFPNSGLPPAGSVLVSTNLPDHSYQLPDSYAAPNAVFADVNQPEANLTLETPGAYTALSFLSSSANANNTGIDAQCIMQYEDGTSETNTFKGKDWFNGIAPAYTSAGRVNLNNRSLNNYFNGVNPRLYEAEFPLGNTTTRLTNIVFRWLPTSQNNSRIAVFAVSGATQPVPPIIVSHPQSRAVFAGTEVTFSVTAGGTPPITYQWQKGTNGVFVNLVDGPNVSGATTPNLTRNNVTFDDAAEYRVIASNSVGPANSLVALLTVLSDLTDVTAPGDTIAIFGGTSPANEPVAMSIDNTTSKYLNFGLNGAAPFAGPVGLVVTPASGASVITALRFYTANDATERDPADYVLEGSTDGTTFTLISSNSVTLPDARNAAALPLNPTGQSVREVRFNNTAGYTTYRLTFTRVKNPATANSVQIGEIEFLGTPALLLTVRPSTFPGEVDLVSSMPGTLQSTPSLNGPQIDWTDVGAIGPDQPVSVTFTGERRFFRVIAPAP